MHSKMEGRGREKQILDQGIGRRGMLTLDTRKTVWQRGYPQNDCDRSSCTENKWEGEEGNRRGKVGRGVKEKDDK